MQMNIRIRLKKQEEEKKKKLDYINKCKSKKNLRVVHLLHNQLLRRNNKKREIYNNFLKISKGMKKLECKSRMREKNKPHKWKLLKQ